jgi:hypothetical protein
MSSIARHIIGREQTMLIKVRHILEGTLFVHSRPFTIEVKVRKHKGILLKLNFEKDLQSGKLGAPCLWKTLL